MASKMYTVEEDWQKRYEEGRTPWQRKVPNPNLVKYADQMTGGKSGLKVFVPFAGKSMDVLCFDLPRPAMCDIGLGMRTHGTGRIAEQGHTVVAVELVEQAVLEFIEENKMEAKKTEVTVDGKALTCYKMMDDRIQYYPCNLFDFPPAACGPVDCVFDRGGLGAVFPPEREKFVAKMLALLSKTGRYLILTYDFPIEEYSWGPRSVSDDTLKSLFGGSLQLTQLECINKLEYAKDRGFAHTYFYEKVTIMTRSE